jgi:RHS repeat-associated protein
MFTGRQLDEEAGLYCYRARQYDSTMGRFLQRDPIDYLAGNNLYEFVNGMPVNFYDPYGFCSSEDSRACTSSYIDVKKFLIKPGDSPSTKEQAAQQQLGESIGSFFSHVLSDLRLPTSQEALAASLPVLKSSLGKDVPFGMLARQLLRATCLLTLRDITMQASEESHLLQAVQQLPPEQKVAGGLALGLLADLLAHPGHYSLSGTLGGFSASLELNKESFWRIKTLEIWLTYGRRF